MKPNYDINIIVNGEDVSLSSPGKSTYIIKKDHNRCEKIHLLDIDLFEDVLVIYSNSISDSFRWHEVLDFDVSQIGNVNYVKRKLFSPNARNYVKSHGLIIAAGILTKKLTYLEYYIGLTTLLGYRVAESKTYLPRVTDFIIKSRIEYSLKSKDITTEEARWRISSAFVISAVIIRNDLEYDIDELYNEVNLLFGFVAKNPIMAQNYFSMALLYSVQKFKNNSFDMVMDTTEYIYREISSSLMSLYSEENKAFLSQTKDMQTLIDIAKSSVILNIASGNSSVSKSTISFRLAPRVNFSIDKILYRFGRHFNSSVYLLDINNKIDSQYKVTK